MKTTYTYYFEGHPIHLDDSGKVGKSPEKTFFSTTFDFFLSPREIEEEISRRELHPRFTRVFLDKGDYVWPCYEFSKSRFACNPHFAGGSPCATL